MSSNIDAIITAMSLQRRETKAIAIIIAFAVVAALCFRLLPRIYPQPTTHLVNADTIPPRVDEQKRDSIKALELAEIMNVDTTNLDIMIETIRESK